MPPKFDPNEIKVGMFVIFETIFRLFQKTVKSHGLNVVASTEVFLFLVDSVPAADTERIHRCNTG